MLSKLHMDFACRQRLRGLMTDDTAELTAQLCTRIGMMMEDASVLALGIGRADEVGRVDVLAQLDAAARRITALVGAVHWYRSQGQYPTSLRHASGSP